MLLGAIGTTPSTVIPLSITTDMALCVTESIELAGMARKSTLSIESEYDSHQQEGQCDIIDFLLHRLHLKPMLAGRKAIAARP